VLPHRRHGQTFNVHEKPRWGQRSDS
jgi:hypothetical protein